MTANDAHGARQPEYGEADLRMAAAVVTQELDEPVQHIITMSDEELLAVEGIQHQQLTPLPWADENLDSMESRSVATATATRSLIARGLVTMEKVTDPRRPGESPADEVAPAVRGTVVARRTSDWVMIAERTTSQGRATGIFYIFDLAEERRAIFEVYDEMGMHLFFALAEKDLAEQFWLWIDPAREIGDEDGELEEYAGSEFARSERAMALREAHAATAVVVRGKAVEGSSAFTLFARPGQVDLMETDGEGDDSNVRIGAVTKERIGELLSAVLSAESAAE